jgi:four helix bundle protein
MSRDHRKLEAFGLADELTVLMYQRTADFPLEERFGLRSQLRRAAVSIPTNLVEGSARESERDYLRFVDIAFGSTREVTYLISLAKRLGYFDEPSAARLEELGRRIQAALSALRAGIKRTTWNP